MGRGAGRGVSAKKGLAHRGHGLPPRGSAEIDIVASNRQYLVFCEVKLRKSADFAAAREFVDARKQQRLRTTALLYLSQHETPLQPRFDVIEIYAPDGTQTRRPQITHMEDAF